MARCLCALVAGGGAHKINDVSAYGCVCVGWRLAGTNQTWQAQTRHEGTARVYVPDTAVCCPLQVELQSLMAIADVDGDGLIDYNEFVAATMHVSKLEKEELLQKVRV